MHACRQRVSASSGLASRRKELVRATCSTWQMLLLRPSARYPAMMHAGACVDTYVVNMMDALLRSGATQQASAGAGAPSLAGPCWLAQPKSASALLPTPPSGLTSPPPRPPPPTATRPHPPHHPQSASTPSFNTVIDGLQNDRPYLFNVQVPCRPTVIALNACVCSWCVCAACVCMCMRVYALQCLWRRLATCGRPASVCTCLPSVRPRRPTVPSSRPAASRRWGCGEGGRRVAHQTSG